MRREVVVGPIMDMCIRGRRVRRPTCRMRLLPMNFGQLRMVVVVAVSVVTHIRQRNRNYSHNHQRNHNRIRSLGLIPYIHSDSIILAATRTIEKR